MTLEEDGRQCYCGKLGCVERYCSADALLHSGETLSDFFRLLRSGAAEQHARWTEYIGWLAVALNNIHMVLDRVIVLDGYIAPYLTPGNLDSLFEAVQTRTAFPENENFLRLGVQDDDTIATGAAIPFIRSFLGSVESAGFGRLGINPRRIPAFFFLASASENFRMRMEAELLLLKS